jgi:hypothetical protein
MPVAGLQHVGGDWMYHSVVLDVLVLAAAGRGGPRVVAEPVTTSPEWSVECGLECSLPPAVSVSVAT